MYPLWLNLCNWQTFLKKRNEKKEKENETLKSLKLSYIFNYSEVGPTLAKEKKQTEKFNINGVMTPYKVLGSHFISEYDLVSHSYNR